MICRSEDRNQISFDEAREQLTTNTMVVFQVYGLLTIAVANIALADVIVQPGYTPVGAAYRTAYQTHQTYPMGHYVSQYPATEQQIRSYVTAYQVPAYPAVTHYQYGNQGRNSEQFVEYSSMPAYQLIPANDQPKTAIVHPSQHMPVHLRARRSTENRTDIGLADDVSTISPVNNIEMVVDSKDPKTRSITSDGNEQPIDVLQNKEADAPAVRSTLLNLNPDRMSRDLPEYKPISYEKPADQPVTIRIIHPEPRMRNPVEQGDMRSWVASTNPTNKQAENQHEAHVDEKVRQHESASPDNVLRNMVQQMQEIQGIAGDKPQQQQGTEFRMNPESTLKQMLDQMNHIGSSQPVSQTAEETARSHEQATATQVDPQSSQLVAATWNNVDIVPQARAQDATQEYITGMAQPSQTPVLQIISHAGPQYEQYRSAAPQWQMIMPSYYAPQVPGYSSPILGYSPQYAAFRNFPDPRPSPTTSDSDKESTEHQKAAADPTKAHNSTAQYREDHSSKDTAGSEKPVYVASAHTYPYETPEMPSMVSSAYYSYPATFRSYLNPYPTQSYVMHENSQDSDPILGSSVHRPHHTKYYHKSPGIYNTRPGHATYITPTTSSYSAVRKGNPYYKSYLPSTHYMTQYQTDPVPQMIHYKVYI